MIKRTKQTDKASHRETNERKSGEVWPELTLKGDNVRWRGENQLTETYLVHDRMLRGIAEGPSKLELLTS